jgi:hypothetical protein
MNISEHNNYNKDICIICVEILGYPVRLKISNDKCKCEIRYCLHCIREMLGLNDRFKPTNAVRRFVECPYCHLPFKCVDGHDMKESCLTQCMKRTKASRIYEEESVDFMNYLDNLYGVMSCPKNCGWTGNRATARPHFSECYRNNKISECKYCSELIQDQEFKSHNNVCLKQRLILCKKCSSKVRIGNINYHLKHECKKSSMECPQCGMLILRQDFDKHEGLKCKFCDMSMNDCKDLINHEKDECGMYPIRCRKCERIFLRRNIDDHKNNICLKCSFCSIISLDKKNSKYHMYECDIGIIYCEKCKKSIRISDYYDKDKHLCYAELIEYKEKLNEYANLKKQYEHLFIEQSKFFGDAELIIPDDQIFDYGIEFKPYNRNIAEEFIDFHINE